MKDTLLWLQLPERKKPDGHCLYTSIKDMGQWVERTSQLPMGEQSRLYYSLLVEVNGLIIPGQKRLELLEQMHPQILKLVQKLSRKCVGHGLPLAEEKNRLAELVNAFLNEMAMGHKIIIDELSDVGFVNAFFKHKILLQATYHALFYLNQKLFYNYILYADHHADEWLDIHQIYYFAVKRHFEKTTIKHLPESIKTIDSLYKKILLFSLANPYHLSITEMTLLWNRLNDWSHYAELLIPDKADSVCQFLIKPYSDTPPFNRLQLSMQTDEFASSQLWGIKLNYLVEYLRKQQNIENVSEYFRKRLIQVWSTQKQREDERQSLIEPVDMVPGVSHISHFLGIANLESEIHELYESQLSSEDNSPAKPALPIFHAFLLDESKGGCRLKLSSENTQKLQPRINEVMAIKHRDGAVHVGYLRWIRENRQQEIELGIEHLSSMAESAQVVITHHQDTAVNTNLLHTRILDSFVFPGGKAQHFKPVLFTHAFIERFAGSGSQDIKLIHKTGEINIKLSQKVDEVLDYNLYLFDRAESAAQTPSRKARTARFDNLWDKL